MPTLLWLSCLDLMMLIKSADIGKIVAGYKVIFYNSITYEGSYIYFKEKIMQLKKFILTFLAIIWTCCLPCDCRAADKNIIILHTNDIHCGINDNIGLAELVHYKKELSKKSEVLLIDAGDAIQGAPIGMLTQGEAMINLMNASGYDFAVPGNHEFDYGMNRFLQLANKLHCGYYSSNLIDLRTDELVLPAYKIIDTAGTRIAFIGVTTPETLTSSTPAYFQDVSGKFIYGFAESTNGQKLYRQVQKNIDLVRSKGAEYVFLIAHLGLNGTAKRYSSAEVIRHTHGLNGVLDGHSHEQIGGVLLEDSQGSPVLLGQTGTKMQKIGRLEIKTDGSINYQLISDIGAKDLSVQKLIDKEQAAYDKLLQQSVGETEKAICASDPVSGIRLVRSRECSLGDFVADAYRNVLDSDAAVVNGGSLRKNLPQGVLTYNDILQSLPFGNECAVIKVTGQQLLDALEMGAAKLPQESGGFLQVSGISYIVDSTLPSTVVKDMKGNFLRVAGAYRVQNVKINGKPLDLSKTYTLGGTVYTLRLGGDGMSMFQNAPLVKQTGLSETDVVLEYLQNFLNAKIVNKYTAAEGENRILIK